jgi:hypothetical protein
MARVEFETYSSHNIYELHNRLVKLTDFCPYAAVIIDGVTTFTRAAVDWSMGFRTGQKKDKQAVDSRNTPQFIPDWDEYKTETSMISQALDMCKSLNTMVIWTAHPLTKLKIEGSGAKVDSVTKGSSLVSYGSKVGEMIPGDFSEIYHFGLQGGNRVVWTSMVGDDFARTSLPLPKQITLPEGGLFFENWDKLVRAGLEELGLKEEKPSGVNPFDTTSTVAPNAGSKWKL